MYAPKRNDSEMVPDFFNLDPMDAPEDGQETQAEHHGLAQTSSHLMAWYMCHFRGCQVVRKSFLPKGKLFGGVTYQTTWWLKY